MIKKAFVLSIICNILKGSPILNDFKFQGYHEMLNEHFGQEYFKVVYSQLDAIIVFVMIPKVKLIYKEIRVKQIKAAELPKL